jgi:hypothetical protein
MWNVKEGVAHRFPADTERGDRLALPPEREAWAARQAELLISGLSSTKYDLIGQLDELTPHPATQPAVSPAALPAGQVLEAAVQGAAAMVVNQYRQAFPAAKPQGARGLVSRVESTVAASPQLKRTVRELSSRSAAVRKLRIMAWRTLERSRARKGA